MHKLIIKAQYEGEDVKKYQSKLVKSGYFKYFVSKFHIKRWQKNIYGRTNVIVSLKILNKNIKLG